jgi:hypothetical protein
MSRKLFWQKAWQEIGAKVAALKSRGASEITTWGRELDSNKLAIVVEVRVSRFGGLWDTIAADGFFVLPDGTREPLQERDLWNLGY